MAATETNAELEHAAQIGAAIAYLRMITSRQAMKDVCWHLSAIQLMLDPAVNMDGAVSE